MNQDRVRAIIIFCFGMWILWGFGYQTLWARLNLDLVGEVTASKDVPSKGAPRYATEYLFRDINGIERKYIAGATDASLERSLPIGTKIRKVRGTLNYEVNGNVIKFPTAFYSAAIGIATVLLLLSGLLFWRARKH